MKKRKIAVISGGQSGVDRAALDAALQLGLEIGGWCPKGRRAEDGPIDGKYPLQETPSRSYPLRTERNVLTAEGTLILSEGRLTGGTALTVKLARRHQKPFWVLDLLATPDVKRVQAWLRDHAITVLNVAGPRESERPGIYHRSLLFLMELFKNI